MKAQVVEQERKALGVKDGMRLTGEEGTALEVTDETTFVDVYDCFLGWYC